METNCTRKPLTAYQMKKGTFAGLHFTLSHTGKMKNVISLSTSPLANPYCVKRQNNANCICKYCFSAAMFKGRYKNALPCFEENGRILSARILSENEIPILPVEKLFRFEAFGDLFSVTQMINYIMIARLNPAVKCALWTKNPQIIREAINAGYFIPSNLQIVLSSPLVNCTRNPETAAKRYPFVSKVFTVFDPETITAKNININCGALSCNTCRKCYNNNPAGIPVYLINEKLK